MAATKILIVHGFEAKPNGAWRPWLMGELGRSDVWACALAMPTPAQPVAQEWVAEITRQVDAVPPSDNIVLVGHSLGVPAILHYLQSTSAVSRRIAGAVLVAGPLENIGKPRIADFFAEPFDAARIRERCAAFRVIHAVDDANVPFSHAERLTELLGPTATLTRLETGAHLNGASGTYALPAALEAITGLLTP